MPSSLSTSPTKFYSRNRTFDSVPGIVRAYAFNDWQLAFARIRYSDVLHYFIGCVCHSIQMNVVTYRSGAPVFLMDELYIGADRSGRHEATLLVAAEASSLRLAEVRRAKDLLERWFEGLNHNVIAVEVTDESSIALIKLKILDGKLKVEFERQYHFDLE